MHISINRKTIFNQSHLHDDGQCWGDEFAPSFSHTQAQEEEQGLRQQYEGDRPRAPRYVVMYEVADGQSDVGADVEEIEDDAEQGGEDAPAGVDVIGKRLLDDLHPCDLQVRIG